MVTYRVVKEDVDGFMGEAILYRLSEPVTYEVLDDETYERHDGKTEYVVASAVVAPFSGVETLVFPADKEGNVLSWLDLAGVKAWDHDWAMSKLVEYVEEQKEKQDE